MDYLIEKIREYIFPIKTDTGMEGALITIKEGYVFKRGALNTDWKKRLFVLNQKNLTYFKGGVSIIYKSIMYRVALENKFKIAISYIF